MPVPVVLFDFDYTLADSSQGVVECVTHALRVSGLPVPPRAEILATIGLSLTAIFERLAPQVPPDRLVSLFTTKADEVVEGLTRVYDDTTGTIQTLAGRGCRLGIASTKFRYRIEAILRREALLQHFEVIVGGEDVTRHKPDPECILRALEDLSASEVETVYVGDSVPDGLAAGAAGVGFVGVLTGVTSRARLLECGPLAVLDRLSGLLPLLDGGRIP